MDEDYAKLVELLSGVDLSPTNKDLVYVADFYEKVPAGSHLAVPSKETLLGPWHHGVYVGNKRVIHMCGLSKVDAHVQETSFNEFMKGTSLVAVVTYADETEETLARTVAVARYLKDNLPVENLYKITDFDCEHFASLCKAGLKGWVQTSEHVYRLLGHECIQQPQYYCKFTH